MARLTPTERFTRALKSRGFTQGELARQLGVNSGVVCNWANGRRRPRLKFALQIQKILGLPVSAWVDAAPKAAA